MSFLANLGSVLGKIGHGFNIGLGIEQTAAPIINLIPGGQIVTSVAATIIAVEHLFPQPGLGAAKAQLVGSAAAQVVPGIDQTATQAAIAEIVSGFNHLAQAAAAVVPKPVT